MRCSFLLYSFPFNWIQKQWKIPPIIVLRVKALGTAINSHFLEQRLKHEKMTTLTVPAPTTPAEAETYLLWLADLSDTQLKDPYTFPWTHLYFAYKTLSMPNTKDRAFFYNTWYKKGPGFPFYEHYLIHAGRVQELIDINVSLASDVGADTTDPIALRRFRDATQDPALATKLREEVKAKVSEAS